MTSSTEVWKAAKEKLFQELDTLQFAIDAERRTGDPSGLCEQWLEESEYLCEVVASVATDDWLRADTAMDKMDERSLASVPAVVKRWVLDCRESDADYGDVAD